MGPSLFKFQLKKTKIKNNHRLAVNRIAHRNVKNSDIRDQILSVDTIQIITLELQKSC